MPKVSVIVPVYNVEAYLRKCLDSLLAQTLKDIEIIVVNDGSTDGSEKILLEYEAAYPNTIHCFKKENGGLSSARNYGIPHATGDYIAFLDSDDYVEPAMYETMYQEAIKKDYDMVECNFLWEYPNKKKIDIGVPYESQKEAMEKARVVAWNKLYKREKITQTQVRFPEGLRYEDVEFFYCILPSLINIGFVNEPFVHYIQRIDSISNTQNARTKEIFTVLNHVLSFYEKNGLWETYKEELEYTYTRYLLCSSLKRMSKVGDKNVRKQLLTETWERLNSTFPNWRKNAILKKKSKKNLYMRSVNKLTFRLYSVLLRFA